MWHILSFVLGAVLGSFSNVVIYRLPRKGLKIWDPPRSFCPNCKHYLSWKDNIPILSYILLRGRCRYCGWRIPPRYFVVEVLSSIFYGMTSYIVRDIALMLGLWGLFTTLVIISFIDLETMMISDYLNVLVLIFSFLISLRIGILIPGSITAGFVLLLLFSVSKLSRSFGMGDVLLLGFSSMAMDLVSLNVAILVAASSALVYSIFKNRGLKLKAAVPFAPFLSIGIVVGILITAYTRGLISW